MSSSRRQWSSFSLMVIIGVSSLTEEREDNRRNRTKLPAVCIGGPLKIDAILGVVRKSEGKVRQVLNELERLELVKKEEGASTGGRKAYVYHLEDCYRSLIPAETIDHKADLARV
jgi:predicted ArsR family transcriptional regulator